MRRPAICALAMLSLAAATATRAADMPVKAPPAAVVAYTWDGWHAGVNVGYSWGRSETDVLFLAPPLAPVVASNSFNMNGWLAGVQIGANRQNGRWVGGFEADWQWTDQKGDTLFLCGNLLCTNSTAVVGPALISSAFSQRLEWFATLRLRGGVTPTPTTFAYLTGGLAVGHVKTSGILAGFNAGGAVVTAPFSGSETTWGWTVGAGFESRIDGRWTAKIEYLYIDFGSVDTVGFLPANAPPLTALYNSDITDHILRVGLNYRFHP